MKLRGRRGWDRWTAKEDRRSMNIHILARVTLERELERELHVRDVKRDARVQLVVKFIYSRASEERETEKSGKHKSIMRNGERGTRDAR
jgi:hypothetical protein